MKKKVLGILLVICSMALFLSSCYSGIGKSDMTITSASGAGTRTFSIEILKDGAINPDDNTVVDQEFTSDGYFPKGINAVVDLLNAKRPVDVPEITLKDETDRYILSYTISFSDINDFNAKTKAIAGQYWDTNSTEPATITTKQADGKTQATYNEDVQLNYVCDQWASHALFDDTTGVYNVALANANFLTPDGATCIYYTDTVSINIGGTTTKFDKNATDITAIGPFENASSSSVASSSSAVTTSSQVSSSAHTSSSPAESSELVSTSSVQTQNDQNPNTGDNGSLMAGIVLTGAALAICMIAIHKKNSK